MKNGVKNVLLCLLLGISPLQGHSQLETEIPQNFSLFLEGEIPNHPVSTSNEEAQRYFNQGLVLLFGFNQDASYWSFKKAAELDPHLAMAYWGMAMALGTNLHTSMNPDRAKMAHDISQKALQLSTSATDNEKAYIEALVQRFSKLQNEDQSDQRFAEAMKKVVERFPDDLDAATLYAESVMNAVPGNLWNPNGSPAKETTVILDTFESVLKRDPEHIGANHYYIHAVEASKSPERGLMSAHRLETLVPNAGHLVHMPAHIYLGVGDYHRAAQINIKASEVDRAYIHRFGLKGVYPVPYYMHNMYFLVYSQLMEGRLDDAMQTAKELYAFYAPLFNEYKGMEFVVPSLFLMPLRFHQWDEVLNQPAPPPQMIQTTAFWHFARAMAFAAKGELPKAYQEQKAFLSMKDQLPLKETFGANRLDTLFSIAELTLSAQLAEKQGDLSSAKSSLQKAIVLEDQLSYSEPPDWLLSPRETLGGLLLRNKQYVEAEPIFREELTHFPRGGRALFGLLESLKGQGRSSDAFWVQQEFNKAWQYSTTPITVNDL